MNPQSGIGILSEKEKEDLLETHRRNKEVLKIPRRPKWDESTSALELQTKEKEEFLEWRRTLALVQEAQALTMTPYEKNLEFWRQLWRVVERSDIVIQIVDARNPLLFRCEDLEKYVKEVDATKMNMILLNKADFLTPEQRQIWSDYFTQIGMRIVFFSAKLSAEETLREQRLNEEDEDQDVDGLEEENDSKSDGDEDSDTASEEKTEDKYTDVSEAPTSESEYESADDGTSNLEYLQKEEMQSPRDTNSKSTENHTIEQTNSSDGKIAQTLDSPNQETTVQNNSLSEEKTKRNLSSEENESKNLLSSKEAEIKNSPELLNREKLIAIFKSMYKGPTFTKGVVTVGLVGYPNVGKSSTINAILMNKKVSVSATPGKTKHFQTLFVDEELLLCDCPGLVMPSFVCTKAEMILNGILPIDQLRDHVPAVTLVGTLIPRHVIEDTYGIMLPPPLEGEDPERPPTAEEILNTYGCSYYLLLIFPKTLQNCSTQNFVTREIP